MKTLFTLMFIVFALVQISSAQTTKSDPLKKKKDSTLRAMIHKDSIKVNKDFARQERMMRLETQEVFPALKGGKYSGIIPVKEPNEIPDPNLDYKILFELTYNNPDSTIQEINEGLDEITRMINLHIASGISPKRMSLVVVVHAAALNALKSNEAFKKTYHVNNPNLNLIHDMEKFGVKFIACGQAMAFYGITREELQPEVKVSLTAQTVITSYQLKGYVWRKININ